MSTALLRLRAHQQPLHCCEAKLTYRQYAVDSRT